MDGKLLKVIGNNMLKEGIRLHNPIGISFANDNHNFLYISNELDHNITKILVWSYYSKAIYNVISLWLLDMLIFESQNILEPKKHKIQNEIISNNEFAKRYSLFLDSLI